MATATPITVAHGDGIGPEIMAATLHILKEAGARLAIEEIEIGEKVYLRGNSAGIEPSAWDSLRRTKVFLKAPITTPQGGGFKSLNVTARKTLGLYANVRPCVSYAPFIRTKHPIMDVVIVRENEEDLYAGIEYRLTANVFETLKLFSNAGCEKICRYAFEYARGYNRKKVTCFTKDNIMKMTDGLFHKVFDEVAAEYPDIQNEHWIVDIGAAKMADTPEVFDVIVMPNLYGDILSDVAAQIAGSVGLAGSANIGTGAAMFEAIHGSAPRRAGQNLANPSGLFLGSILMLVYIGQNDIAELAHNAWLKTIEDGVHTYDIFQEGKSKQKVGTKEFADAVVARLGQKPETLKVAKYAGGAAATKTSSGTTLVVKDEVLVGADLHVEWKSLDTSALAAALQAVVPEGLELQLLSNRGVKIWPGGAPETIPVDKYRCRFLAKAGSMTQEKFVELMGAVTRANVVIVQAMALRNYDGVQGFSLAQGQ